MNTYYQLLERDTSTVNLFWKGIHILSLIVAIISGFITAFFFGRAIDAFGDNCVLYAEIAFENENTTELLSYRFLPLPNNLTAFDPADTHWGSYKQCYFCQFTPIITMIFGITWLALFLTCSKGGAGYITDEMYQPWRLVYPVMVFAAACTVALLVSTLDMSNGINKFCAQFESIFGTIKCTNNIDLYTFSFHSFKRFIYFPLKLSIIFSYICFASWLTLLTTLVMRVLCVADFQMVRIVVLKKDEEGGARNETSASPVVKDKKSSLFGFLRKKSTKDSLNKGETNKASPKPSKTPVADSEPYTDEVQPRKVSFKLSDASFKNEKELADIPLNSLNDKATELKNEERNDVSEGGEEEEETTLASDEKEINSTSIEMPSDDSSEEEVPSSESRTIGRK